MAKKGVGLETVSTRGPGGSSQGGGALGMLHIRKSYELREGIRDRKQCGGKDMGPEQHGEFVKECPCHKVIRRKREKSRAGGRLRCGSGRSWE